MSELLAPVGSFEKLKAAVYSGADAVYFGFKKFSARKNAQNFDLSEIVEVVRFCHDFGVKAYVTLNTIVNDDELKEVKHIICQLKEIGVDALIVQDLGVLKAVKQVAPDFKIHASTQMSVHSVSGVRFLREIGVSRVVVAREMALSEIEEVCREKIEIEVFVHGALCYCVSGQCLMSAMLGGRSANRGECAQPCRLPFYVFNPPMPDLSLKDLCAIDVLDKLKKAGVCSFKIEGRMKRPEYVAAATLAYRNMIDGYSFDKNSLLKVFSRGGFTNGYINDRRGRNMFGVRSKKDAATKDLYSKIKEDYRRPLQRFYVDFEIVVKKGQPICLMASDGFIRIKILGDVPEKAKTIDLNENKLKECFRKLGGTIYKLRQIKVDVDYGLFVSNSHLNDLKKSALLKLSRQRVKNDFNISIDNDNKRQDRFKKEYINKNYNEEKDRLRAECDKFDQVVCCDEFELICVDIDELFDNANKIGNLVEKIGILMPQTMFGRESELVYKIDFLKKLGVRHATVQNLGQIDLLDDFIVHGGFSLNIANSESVDFLNSVGFNDFIVSTECSLETVATICKKIPLGIIAAGRLPLMVSRNCPVNVSCDICKNSSKLLDRKGKLFPVRCGKDSYKIFNSNVLWVGDRQSELKNVDFKVLKFTVENKSEAEKTVEQFIHKEELNKNYTRGLYYKGI